MSTDSPDPRRAAVRRALGRLCTKAVRGYWIHEEAQALLDLRCVRERSRRSAMERRVFHEEEDPDGRAEALVEVLRDLVGRIRTRPDGRLLWIVLGLDPRWRARTATERRREAGKTFRGGVDPVGPNTIRQVHEPRALDRLTSLLIAHEDAQVAAAAT
jgi:hypothetical protein